jgi:hypothetical protein
LSGNFGIADRKAKRFGLLQEKGVVDQLVNGLFFNLEHFEHAIIEIGAESLAVLINHIVISSPEVGKADGFSIDGGNFGCLAGTKTTDSPKDEHNYDGEQNNFDHPTAGMFPHYVEHSLPLVYFNQLESKVLKGLQDQHSILVLPFSVE